jgi:hypothetical protein
VDARKRSAPSSTLLKTKQGVGARDKRGTRANQVGTRTREQTILRRSCTNGATTELTALQERGESPNKREATTTDVGRRVAKQNRERGDAHKKRDDTGVGTAATDAELRRGGECVRVCVYVCVREA